MRARQRAAGNTDSHAEEPQGAAQPSESVVFDGGFFQVESPVKPPGEGKLFPRFQLWLSWSDGSSGSVVALSPLLGSQRRSSRLGSVWPQASPCCPSPRRVTRRSRPLVPVPASPSQLPHAPSRPCQTPEPAPKSLCATPGSSQKQHPGKASLPASACSVVAETLAAVSVAEAADVPPSTRESLPPVSPGAEPTHPQLSFTLTPCASPSPAPASPQPPAEVANTSAVEVTNLVLPAFPLLRRVRPYSSYSPLNLGDFWLGFRALPAAFSEVQRVTDADGRHGDALTRGRRRNGESRRSNRGSALSAKNRCVCNGSSPLFMPVFTWSFKPAFGTFLLNV